MNKLALLRCEDQCTKKESITFNHKKLETLVKQLQTPAGRDFLTETFSDFFDDAESVGSLQLVQVPGSEYQMFVDDTQMLQLSNETKPVKTTFNNPPLPRTKVPSNPCNDPNKGAPSADDK